MIGNLTLAVLAVLALYSLSLTYGKTPSDSGDAAMAYPLTVILVHLLMLGCLLVITGIASSKGAYDWAAAAPGMRRWLVWGGLLAMVLTSVTSALFKYEAGPVPNYFRVFTVFTPALLPLIWVVGSALLLHQGFREMLAPGWYQGLIKLGWVVGFAGTAALGAMLLSARSSHIQAELNEIRSRASAQQAQDLQEIDAADAGTDILGLLTFTDAQQDAEIRTRAVEKIKSNPDWQRLLIRILDHDYYADQAFIFLASNDADDPEALAEPIRRGILQVAQRIQNDTRKASYHGYFYADQYRYEIERVLRTAEKYEGRGVDYLPALRQLRTALDEPSPYKEKPFSIVRTFDQWLKKRGG